MTGLPKGRTIKAMRERVAALMVDDELAEEGAALRSYLATVVASDQLRVKNLKKLPHSQVKALAKSLHDDGYSVTNEIASAMVDRELAEALKSADRNALLTIAAPWTSEETPAPFDQRAPRVAAMRWKSMAEKIEIFRRMVFGRLVTPMVTAGADRVSDLRPLLEALVERFKDVDVVMVGLEEAELTEDIMTACRILQSILEYPLDASVAEDLHRMEAAKSKSRKNILCSLCTAIAASPFYCDRLAKLKKALPSIVQFGTKLQDHATDLTQIPKQFDIVPIEILGAMSKTIVMCQSSNVPLEFYRQLSHDIWSFLMNMWQVSVTDGHSKLKTKSGSQLNTILAALEDIGSAFPTKLEVLEMRKYVSDLVKSLDAGELLEKLLAAVGRIPEDLENSGEAASCCMAEIAELGADCVGLPPSAEQKKVLQASFLKIFVQGWPHFERNPEDTIFTKQALHALEKLAEVLDDPNLLLRLRGVELHLRLVSMVTEFSVCDSAGAPDDSAMFGKLHELSVIAKQAEQSLKAIEEAGGLGDGASSMVQAMKQKIAEAQSCEVKAFDELLTAARKKMMQVSADIVEAMQGVHPSKPWHTGLPKSATFEQLKAKAVGVLDKIDAKKLEEAIAAQRSSSAAFQKLWEQRGETVEDPDFATALKRMHEAVQVKVEANILWHLCEESNPQALRTKMQSELKQLRATGAKEQEVFHPAMYAAGYKALTSKRTVASST